MTLQHETECNFPVILTENYVPYHNVLMPSIFGVICFFGIIGNCIVIYTIVKKTKFRAQQTVPDIFIFSLSLVDLLFLLGMPFLIHQLMGNGSWCFGDIMCTVITALDSNSQIVSTYILTVMTLDRYLATVHPIRWGLRWGWCGCSPWSPSLPCGCMLALCPEVTAQWAVPSCCQIQPLTPTGLPSTSLCWPSPCLWSSSAWCSSRSSRTCLPRWPPCPRAA